MKQPTDLIADVTRRLARTWAADLTGQASSWPARFTLSLPKGGALEQTFTATLQAADEWNQWTIEGPVTIEHVTRRVHGTDQRLPSHVTVATIDDAAVLAGEGWPARLERGRTRAHLITSRYNYLERADRALAAVDAYSDVNFDLLCRAADWFATHDAAGLTPRQVPIEGLHAKWLNTRHRLIADLAGIATLSLAPRHPARIHFTYLDPDHLGTGGRQHDSATVGDVPALAYTPNLVLISENKDTAICFPPMPGAIAVEGVGRGGTTLATFDWIRNAPALLYWGDMDADGLEILDEFRAVGLPAHSMFMDEAAYDQWRRYGTDVDASGRPLTARTPRPVEHLTNEEAALYRRLCSEAPSGPRRVEQERIPLEEARITALSVLTGS